MLTFSEIAVMVLEANGLVSEMCASEDEARKKAACMAPNTKTWPCYFFASDTTGEKPYEEFYTETDRVDFGCYSAIGVIRQPPWTDRARIEQALAAFENIRRGAVWRKEDMVDAIRIIVPELQHEEKGRNLDQKM